MSMGRTPGEETRSSTRASRREAATERRAALEAESMGAVRVSDNGVGGTKIHYWDTSKQYASIRRNASCV